MPIALGPHATLLPGPILGHFWDIFGTFLGRFWANSGTFLGHFGRNFLSADQITPGRKSTGREPVNYASRNMLSARIASANISRPDGD
jgi:hypothetical protein